MTQDTASQAEARERAATFAFEQRDDSKPSGWNEACDHIANAFRHEANPFGGAFSARSSDDGAGEEGKLAICERDFAVLRKDYNRAARLIEIMRERWEVVSGELDHIPGGMHVDLEDAASSLATAMEEPLAVLATARPAVSSDGAIYSLASFGGDAAARDAFIAETMPIVGMDSLIAAIRKAAPGRVTKRSAENIAVAVFQLLQEQGSKA